MQNGTELTLILEGKLTESNMQSKAAGGRRLKKKAE